MATEQAAIDVDADAADVPPPRIVRGTGNAAAPLEIASSDSEDERRPPAKRAKATEGKPFMTFQSTARATTPGFSIKIINDERPRVKEGAGQSVRVCRPKVDIS